MQLYSYFRSSAAYRVRIVLNYKGIDYQHIGINMLVNEQRSDDFLALNPQGLVPALCLDDGTMLTQSTAILEWLEEVYPEPPLYPQDLIERAKVRMIVNAIACDIHPLNNLRVLKYLKNELGVGDEQKAAWYQHWIAMGFDAVERQISGAPYARGDSISLADVYLIPQVYNALRFKQDMAPYPKILSIYRACNLLDAFAAAAPEAQPDSN